MEPIELIIEKVTSIQFEGLLLDFFTRSKLPLSSIFVKAKVSPHWLSKDKVEPNFHQFEIAEKPDDILEGSRPLASINCQDYPEHVVVFIRGIGNDSNDWEEVIKLVKEIIRKAEQLKFKITSLPKDLATESTSSLWEKIKDHLSDRMIVRLWNEGKSNSEIAPHVFLKPRSVTNVLSRLRDKYGEDIVLTNSERRKRLMKN